MKGRITKLLILLATSLLPPLKGNWGAAYAQTAGTISSYSRFGLGLLHDQSQGFNKSMGGVGLGVRIGNRINTMNPASYSAIDSLSLILDIGMSGSFGQMRQDAKKAGVNSATLDYVHAGMHVGKRLGLAVGYMPYTSIGYSFYSPEKAVANDDNTTMLINTTNDYEGSGGLNQAYIGLGWKAYKNLSVGANISFLWGQYNHSLVPIFEEGGVATSTFSATNKLFTASLKTYKIDLGAQYPVRLTSQDWLNLGATVGLGHNIPQDATLLFYTTKGDTTTYTARSAFDLPYAIGYGASWQHKNTLLVAADVHHELWGKCRMPVETQAGYEPMKGGYKDMTKFAVGAQYTPNPFGKYWQRVQYRAGVNYSTPYLKINEHNGPHELRLTLGAGLPIQNKINSRSVVNVGVQWLRRSASAAGMVKEDYLVVTLGLTFNERWFMRYKIE
ncbi:MAG: hypothetical protein IJS63_02610 [Bacteroidaceae bacterium]|nr:hypothetical protein [Bacteroidaceae bacterium]